MAKLSPLTRCKYIQDLISAREKSLKKKCVVSDITCSMWKTLNIDIQWFTMSNKQRKPSMKFNLKANFLLSAVEPDFIFPHSSTALSFQRFLQTKSCVRSLQKNLQLSS